MDPSEGGAEQFRPPGNFLFGESSERQPAGPGRLEAPQSPRLPASSAGVPRTHGDGAGRARPRCQAGLHKPPRSISVLSTKGTR